ncbi:hypothetical protein WA158_005184 [Blastocystis sp. Blastoise]
MERRERWKCISKVVSGKSVRECMSRAKYLSELAQQKSNNVETATDSNPEENHKRKAIDFLKPYLGSIDPSVKEYITKVFKDFNNYDDIITLDSLSKILMPLFDMIEIIDRDRINDLMNNILESVNNDIKSHKKDTKIQELSEGVIMKDPIIVTSKNTVINNINQKKEINEVKQVEEQDWKIEWEDHEVSDQTIIRERGRGPTGRSKNIDIKAIDISIKGESLLENACLRLHEGYHYGLIGRNGVGKTTLLRRMASCAIKGFPDYLLVLHVKQEIDGTENTVLNSVIESDVERTELIQEEASLMTQLESPIISPEETKRIVSRLQTLGERRDIIDVEGAEGRAKSILEGLGFIGDKLYMKTNELSGGWRMRVALACALFIKPDILLLDEPTNHLDLQAVLWLEQYIQEYTGTVVVVSHDRSFLNSISQEIIEFTHKELRYWAGNYDEYIKAKEDKRKMIEQLQTTLDEKRDHVKDQIQKLQEKAKKDTTGGIGNLVKSRTKKMNRMGFEKNPDGKKWGCQKASDWGMESMRVGSINGNYGGWVNGKRTAASLIEQEPAPIKFTCPECPRMSYNGSLIKLDAISFSYPSPTITTTATTTTINNNNNNNNNSYLLKDITLTIDFKDKISILGPNGIGKSTLINLLMGHLQPNKGEVYRWHNLRIGYFTQHHVETLNLNISALTHMCRPMGTLSGGQKSRVVLATIAYQQPHIYILDEPTNHLDIESIEALSTLLKEFQGAVILVTHDQYLVENVCKDLYVIEPDGHLLHWNKSFNDYKKYALKIEKSKKI